MVAPALQTCFFLVTLACAVSLAACTPILGFNPANNVQPLQISTQINVPGAGPATNPSLASLFQPINLLPRLLPRTRTMAAINALGDNNRRREILENMLRIGVLLHTLDFYRDDIALMVERYDDVFGGSWAGLDTVGTSPLSNILPSAVTDHIPLPPHNEYFVEIHGGNFMIGDKDKFGNAACRKLYVSGTNKYEFVEAGSGVPLLFDGRLDQRGLVGPEVVRRVFEEAHEQGLDFIRFNAFSVTDHWCSITGWDTVTDTISLNEVMMRGLDYVLEQARVHKIKVILVLTDYFADACGGPLQYMELSGTNLNGLNDDEIKALFYGNSEAQLIYRSYINAIANRVNTYNGRLYRNDPVIFAWDIMNEPRCDWGVSTCYNANADYIADFVGSTYAYLVNTLQVKQPVTVGTDGFYYGTPYGSTSYAGLFGSTATAVNPVNEPDATLADFARLCALVDFCEFNTYPDLWGQENAEWVAAWVAAHAATGRDLGKPVIVKEQGMQPTTNRKRLYKIMYDVDFAQILADKANVGGLKGAAYFQIWVKGTEAIFWTLDKGGRFGIQPSDPEIHIIRQFSWKVGDLSKLTISGELCPSGFVGTAMLLPPPSCPYGYAGPTCADLDECLLGTDHCSVNSACLNTDGSYECDCFNGFRGNGRLCVPTLSLHRIEKIYYTRDTLSCVSGSTDVPYPSNAPGYSVDPTNKFPAGYPGNHVPVTLLECKIACDMAELCTSFYYDPIQGTCILKRNQCPNTASSVTGCNNCNRPVCDAPNVTICDKEVYTPNSPASPTEGSWECTRGITYFKKGYNYGADNPLCDSVNTVT